MYNKSIILGNLAQDVELKATNSGKSVGSFSVAVNRKVGEKQEVSFIGCQAWDKTAEAIAKFFKKGDAILVEGRLKQESWEKDGKKNSRIILVVEQFSFTGGKKKEDSAPESDDIAY